MPEDWNGRPRIGGWKSDRPKVGKLLLLQVVNYNPYRDDVDLTVKYEEYFANAQAEFKKLLPVPGAATNTPESESEGSSDSLESRGSRQLEPGNLIRSFAQDLNLLYTTLYSRSSINPVKLAGLLARVDQSLAVAFDLGAVNVASLRARGLQLIDQVSATEKDKYTALLEQGITTYQQLHTYVGNLGTTTQIQSKDRMAIEVQVSRDKVAAKNSQTLEIPVRGGFGFGYSVGFMYSPLRNYSYELVTVEHTAPKSGDNPDEPTTDTEVVKMDSVTRKDEGNFTIGGLALGHVYYRVSPFAYAAISTGFGVKGDLDTYYFAGGSVLFGRQKEFVFTAGYAFAKVKRLGGGLQEGQVLEKGDERGSRITDTRDVSESDWFVAVSYRF